MPPLDPRSLIIVAGLLGLLCGFMLLVMRRSFPASIHGISEWGLGNIFFFTAALLTGLRGILPDLLSVVIGNSVLLGGVLLVHVGLLRFLDRAVPWRRLLALLGVAVLYLTWFALVQPEYLPRLLMVTAFNTVFFLYNAVTIVRVMEPSFANRFSAAGMFMIVIVCGTRFLTLFAEDQPSASLLAATPLQQAYLAGYSVSVLFITLGVILMVNDRLRTTLEHLAFRDSLSGAYNRRAFLEIAERELARADRRQRTIALLMMDLDHFKSVNDRHGHAAGDRVIVDFCRRVGALLRRQDIFARYGGEEFVVLLPDTARDEAHTVAQRICSSVAAPGGEERLPLYTVSIGLATLAGAANESIASLIGRADAALYRAKENGRNRVEEALAA